MRYERPRIVRRDPIAGLLAPAPSDVKQPDSGDGNISDVNIKENIVPVRW